jgi:hypothetical protein
MAEGVWVLLGTALGTIGSLATTWLSAHLSRRSPHPKFDKAVQKVLSQMLSGEYNWRKLETLANVTGLTQKEVKEYLIELKARGSEVDPQRWGLISKNPLSNIPSDD